MRKVVTVITALVAVLTVAPATVAQTPAATVTVTQFDCESVTVTGSGWEQTEATVEVGVLPPESGEIRGDLIAGPIQVFPDEQGNIAPTVVPFNSTPPDGDHTAVVLVDGLVRGQSPIFTLTGCGAAPAATVTVTQFDCESVTVTGSGWEKTEATVEVGVPPSEGGSSPADLVAGPVRVFPDAQGNIAPTVVPVQQHADRRRLRRSCPGGRPGAWTVPRLHTDRLRRGHRTHSADPADDQRREHVADPRTAPEAPPAGRATAPAMPAPLNR